MRKRQPSGATVVSVQRLCTPARVAHISASTKPTSASKWLARLRLATVVAVLSVIGAIGAGCCHRVVVWSERKTDFIEAFLP